jgi:hypothetical protein
MILQYIKRVKRNGLVSANSWLYSKIDDDLLPPLKTAVARQSVKISDTADMAQASSMYRAIKTYIVHRVMLVLLRF